MTRALGPILAGGLMLAAAGPTLAAELYVDAGNSTGTELGTKQSPFRTVQAAIDAAADGDEIRVAGGVYTQNLRIAGKGIVLNGGFSSDWVRDVSANPTTLAGDGEDAVVNLIESDSTIDGFRITGGGGSTEELPYGYHGGGIYSRDGSPTISNNLIDGNDIRSGDGPFDYHFGGGIHVTNATTATIVSNVVRGNTAGRGAGVSVFGQTALIQGNTIENNVAVGDHGGGLFIGVVNAQVTQNVIRGNEVGRTLGYGWGGGLIVVNSGNTAELSFNEVYENFAAGYGAGEFIDEGARANIHHELIYGNVSKDGCEVVSAIAVDGGDGVGSQATISHCTVVGNICEGSVRGNGLQVEGQSIVSVTNSIFWNNGGDDFAVFDTSSLSVSYTCAQEAFVGTGNISADPRFVDASADDYRLAAGSPCINVGDPASPFDQEPADNGGRADMGRFGNAAEAPPADRPDGVPPMDPFDGPVVGGPDEPVGGGAGTGGDSESEPDDTIPPVDDAVSGAGLCPAASAMLLSISLLGIRRSRHRQVDSGTP